MCCNAEYNYSGPVESALEYVLTPSTYIQFQLGMLLVLPLVPWLFLEKGFGSALRKLLDLMSKFSVTYYNFMSASSEFWLISDYTRDRSITYVNFALPQICPLKLTLQKRGRT